MNKGSVRRGQLVTTYGVGAVVAIEDESFMTAGLDHWTVGPPNLHEKRLERELGVQGFMVPPAHGARSGEKDIPVVRFPQMYFCNSDECVGRLMRHKDFGAGWNKNSCGKCRETLVPSRFVVACEHGHIDDFPYFAWVHKDGTQPRTDKDHKLFIKAGGMGASLADIVVSCSCGKSSTLQGVFGKNALAKITRCTGRRPWLGDSEACDCVPRALQRGASNVYFSVTASAISIPPWSEGAHKVINQYWTVLKAIPDVALLPTIEGMGMHKGTPFKPEDLATAVRQRKGGDEDSGPTRSIREEEYEALSVGRQEASRDQDFVCLPAESQLEVAEWFDKVMLATRLREVMALTGFTRLLPLSSDDTSASKDRIAPLAKETKDWLPAIEVQGEGVFLSLDMEAVKAWEGRDNVRERAKRINQNYKRKFEQWGIVAPQEITARQIMIHTLAHVLINQWSLDCGYPAGSLRERLYVSAPGADVEMAGLLIYTATSDAAGSLGGVVALADVGKLRTALEEAISEASWCSSDPLCIEADAAGADSLNLAACHSCVLLPEVSCERGNSFLDRALLVGSLEDSSFGFFADLVPRS